MSERRSGYSPSLANEDQRRFINGLNSLSANPDLDPEIRRGLGRSVRESARRIQRFGTSFDNAELLRKLNKLPQRAVQVGAIVLLVNKPKP